MSIQMLRTRIKSLRMYSVRQGRLRRNAGMDGLLGGKTKEPFKPLADTEDALRIQLAGTEE